MNAAPHDDTIETLIPWYANGTLSPEERRRVEDHVRHCAPCKSLLEETGALSSFAESDFDALLEHVHVRHLDAFARDPDAVPDELRAFIGDHLASCDVCREALDPLRRAHELAKPEERRSSGAREDERKRADSRQEKRGSGDVVTFPLWRTLSRTLLHPAAAALYLVAALAAVPVYFGLLERPAPDRGAARMGAASGVVELVIVSSPTRGSVGPTRVTRPGPGLPLALGVDLAVPSTLDAGDEITLALVRLDGSLAWSGAVTVEKARESLDRTGIVTLLIPAGPLEAGRYTLGASFGAGTSGSPLLEAEIEID